jgi:hypothetical protein
MQVTQHCATKYILINLYDALVRISAVWFVSVTSSPRCGGTRSLLIMIQVVHICVQPPERKTQSAGPIMRRYPSVPLEGGPVMYPQPPPHLLTTPQGTPCYTCIAVPVSSSAAHARYHGQAQPFYCMNHHLQTLHLDGDASHRGSNSSSASDSSSAGHSPPDTPSMPTAPHWDNKCK